MIGHELTDVIGGLRVLARPREPLLRIRWLFLAFALANLAPASVIVAVAGAAGPPRLLGLAGLATLAILWVAAYRRRSLSLLDDVVSVASSAVVAWTMAGVPGGGDVTGVLFSAVFFVSLFGSPARVIGRAAAFFAVEAAALSAQSAPVEDAAMLGLGFFIVAGLMHLLSAFVARTDDGTQREQVLAATGLALVAAADLPQIARCAVEGASAICSESALRVVLALEDEEHAAEAGGAPSDADRDEVRAAARENGPTAPPWLRIVAVEGELLGDSTGRLVDGGRLFGSGELIAEQGRLRVDGAAAARFALAGLPLVGSTLVWSRLTVDGAVRGFLFIETDGELAGDLEPTLRTLATQVSLAISRADLQKEAVARRSAERFQALVQNSSDVITIVDPEGRIRYQSPAALRVFGHEPEAMSGAAITSAVHPDDVERVNAAIQQMLATPADSLVFECRIRHADGSWRDAESRLTNLLDEPAVSGLVLNTRDVTERRMLEAELRHQAFHDSLTGLANRILFGERVQQSIVHARRDGSTIAVLFIDLEGFKRLNDSLGYAAGDAALVAVAERLRACVRAPDTVARLGGDEFGVLLDRLNSPADATIAVERIMASLRQPLALPAASVELQPSIGIAISMGGDDSPEDLIRNGAVAMHRAKSFEGGYTIFDPEMHAAAIRRLEMESQLRAAIDEDQLVVFYQPTIQLETGRLTGVEALVRWQHPKRGIVPPIEFIPLAEECGLIVPLGRTVIREACRQVRLWQQEIPADEPLSLGVNLSARQLRHPTIVRDIADALDDTGLLPSRLILEITESDLMVDTAATLNKLFQLKSLGVRLAIDDFGTGYSSFAYLRRFPVDILKIDKSFVDGVATEPTASALVDAMIRIGKTLRLETVAEGVERTEQAEQLRALKCDVAQGYLFSRPLARDAISDFLRERACLPGRDQASAA